MATNLVNYHRLADDEIGNDLISKAILYIGFADTASLAYTWIDVCSLQLYEEGQINWYSTRYNTMIKQTPKVGGTSLSTLKRILNWVSVGAYLYTVIDTWKSYFYWYDMGFNIGALFSTLIVAVLSMWDTNKYI